MSLAIEKVEVLSHKALDVISVLLGAGYAVEYKKHGCTELILITTTHGSLYSFIYVIREISKYAKRNP